MGLEVGGSEHGRRRSRSEGICPKVTPARRSGSSGTIASTDSYPGSIRTVVDLAAALRGAFPNILPVVGQGPVQDVADLLNQHLAAALIPSDVLPYLGRMRRLPGAQQSLRYIAALFRQEVHVLALSNFTGIAGLARTPVNLGPPDSRDSITASTIFDSLGIQVQPTLLDQATALEALRERRVTALVHVARKPAQLFFALNQGDGLHFLPVPLTTELSSIYLPSELGVADYPLLIGQGEAGRGQPIPTVAVPTVIAVSNSRPGTERYRNLSLLIDALFPISTASRQQGAQDSIWADFDPALDVPGWRRFAPAAARLQGEPASVRTESSAQPTARETEPQSGRSQQDRRGMSSLERQKLFQDYLRWKQTQGQP